MAKDKKPKSGPEAQPEQQQPSSAEIIKQMKNTIKVSIGDAEENILKIFDSVIQQLGVAAQQINKQQSHINSLEQFFKDNGIPLDVLIPKQQGQPGPNREVRRKIQKAAEKAKSKIPKKA